MRTRLIPIIEGEVVQVEECSWCGIPLWRDGLPPIKAHGRRFHVVCVRAYAHDVGGPDTTPRRTVRT